MLTIKMVTNKLEDQEISYFKYLYEVSFPEVERISFTTLIEKATIGIGDFLGLYVGGRAIGMMYYIESDSFVYLFYFAIDKDCQSKGYGKEALKRFIEQMGTKVVALSIEKLEEKAANSEQRYRRLRFYERLGFLLTGETITERGETFDVMSSNGEAIKEDYIALMEEYFHRYVL